MHTARDLMRRQVLAVSPQTSSEDAMDLLIENEVLQQQDSVIRGASTLPTEGELDSGGNAAETSAPPTKSFCPPLDERRQATRFQHEQDTDFAVVWREPDDEILVDVHDESLTGLGIVADTDLDLQVGSQVHVVYAGEYLEGEVVHIMMLPEGNYRIGLRCERLLPEAAE